MKTRLLGGVAALVLAIVGAVLLATYVQAADKRAQAGMSPAEVYVVQQPIAAGSTADQIKKLVTAVSLPKAALAEGAVTNMSGLAGKVAGVDLLPGEQLLQSRLVDPAKLMAPNQVDVPKGLEELTLKLAPERVLGGTLHAGDTVGIFISYNEGVSPGTPESQATRLQFHKVLVTRIGDGAAADSAQQNAQSNPDSTVMVTLAQSGKDAVRTVHGIEFGKIYLSKENAGTDTSSVDTLNKDGVLR